MGLFGKGTAGSGGAVLALGAAGLTLFGCSLQSLQSPPASSQESGTGQASGKSGAAGKAQANLQIELKPGIISADSLSKELTLPATSTATALVPETEAPLTYARGLTCGVNTGDGHAFEDWCVDSQSGAFVPADAHLTTDAVMGALGVKSCAEVDDALQRNGGELDLTQSAALGSLAPLGSLKHLCKLELGASAAGTAGIESLSAATAMVVLRLGGAKAKGFEFVKPIVHLVVLEAQAASGDLSPVGGLVALRQLAVRGSGVVDVSPLKTLSALQSLDLSGNAVVDAAPLAGLSRLTMLTLTGNPVADKKICPVAPASICLF